jgi:hypothetical protein
MHYAAVSVLERLADENLRAAIAAGSHLSTLAFSEVGWRSHFWAPLGGRQRRLIHLGFPADEAADISALHTKNFR